MDPGVPVNVLLSVRIILSLSRIDGKCSGRTNRIEAISKNTSAPTHEMWGYEEEEKMFYCNLRKAIKKRGSFFLCSYVCVWMSQNKIERVSVHTVH